MKVLDIQAHVDKYGGPILYAMDAMLGIEVDYVCEEPDGKKMKVYFTPAMDRYLSPVEKVLKDLPNWEIIPSYTLLEVDYSDAELTKLADAFKKRKFVFPKGITSDWELYMAEGY